MGQNNAKSQKTSNLRNSSSRKNGAHSLVVAQESSPDQQPSLNDTIAAKKQTGNLIISIHMLTMNNSNEVNSNSCRSIAGSCVNSAVTEISAVSSNSNNSSCSSKQTVDQYNNDKQQQQNGVNASTSACKKFNSKYNKATLVSKSPATSSQQESNNTPTCDNQSISNNNNNSVNNNEISNSPPATSTNNFRLSSCPFADRISTMLGNKCKFGSSSNNSTIGPVASGTSASTAKVRKGILGKFKTSTKQKQKSRDEKVPSDDANSSLNTSNTSSSSNGSEKTDTTCTHCTASSHRLSDEMSLNSTRQFPASAAAAASEAISLTYNPNNSVLLPNNTSISITSGGSAATGSTAIILPDSALLHSNGFPTTAALYGSLNNTSGGNFILVSSLFDMTRLSDDSLEDCDEQARLRRARQIAEGVEAPPGFVPSTTTSNTASSLQSSHLQTLLCSIDPLHSALRNRLLQQQPIMFGEEYPRVHSQVSFDKFVKFF